MSRFDRHNDRLTYEAELDAKAPPDVRDAEDAQRLALLQLPHREACTRLANALRLLYVWSDDDNREFMHQTLREVHRIIAGDITLYTEPDEPEV